MESVDKVANSLVAAPRDPNDAEDHGNPTQVRESHKIVDMLVGVAPVQKFGDAPQSQFNNDETVEARQVHITSKVADVRNCSVSALMRLSGRTVVGDAEFNA